MATIEEVKAKHANRLLAYPGVTSIGIGRTQAGEPALIVGLDKEQSAGNQTLPSEIEGYPVRTHVIGVPQAQ